MISRVQEAAESHNDKRLDGRALSYTGCTRLLSKAAPGKQAQRQEGGDGSKGPEVQASVPPGRVGDNDSLDMF